MKIFINHTKNFDYEKELYTPIKEHFKNDASFFLPEEHHINTKQVIKDCDIFFAEVTFGGNLGAGIEIGWADAFNKPIYCFYKEGAKVSNSLRFLTSNIYPYKDVDDLMNLMDVTLTNIKANEKGKN